jgi:predicted ATPase
VSGVLLGREAELDEIEHRLATSRLVTVVGPGGVGKTTLAMAAAARAAHRFPHGVFRVDLTRVDSADAVPGALASQLGFDSFASLLSAPGEVPALVVVDNCEHLLDAAAASIDRFLATCEQPTVLATSRSPLELPWEAVIPLAPLTVPDLADPDPGAAPAVQLFLERASAAGATIDEGDLDVVAATCRRLDGLPLAVELAAVRSRTMSVREIADRLEAGVDVLERRHFRGERRHRSIADTIRWSYDLLAPGPAELLKRLAVFAGPFARHTAEAVAGSGQAFADDLEELVYASLVSVDTTGADSRYRLLDTVRRFALARLWEAGEAEATTDRFVDVVTSAAVRSVRDGRRVWRPEMIRELLEAFDDIAEALRWCNERDDDPGRSLTLCSVLWTVVHQGRADDVVILARQTVDRWTGTAHPRLAAAVATLATAEYVTGEHQRAMDLAEPALRDLPPPGTPLRGFAGVTLQRVIGQAHTALGRLDRAEEAFAAGAAEARARDMMPLAIELDVARAQVVAAAGDVDTALEELDRSCTEAAEAGSPVSEVWARTALGWQLLRRDVDRAESVVRAALESTRRLGYPIGVSGNLRSLAYVHLLRGDLTAARETLLELLDDLLGRGALAADSRLLVDATAALAHMAGHHRWAELAATARTLPFSSLVSVPESAPIHLPATEASPLPRVQAVAAAKAVLDDLSAGPAPTPVAAAPEPAGPPSPAAVLGRRGDVWEATFDGSTVSLRASKGLADLARLLAAPGREIHCLDLAGAGAEDASTGEVIDATARRRYEARLRELQDDIDEAEQRSDLARAERAQAEFDALVDHLTSALGRGGRARSGGGTTERARSAVTQRIRGTIRRVEEAHPALGRHLRASVTTGTWCAYRPEVPVDWDVSA